MDNFKERATAWAHANPEDMVHFGTQGSGALCGASASVIVFSDEYDYHRYTVAGVPLFEVIEAWECDPVNHPKHYTSDPSGVECITITRHRNFAIGSAFKYLWRAGLKDGNSNVQDLRKAVWYINDEIKRIEGGTR